MGLEDVRKEITDKSKEEARLILQDAKDKEKEILKEIDDRLSKIEEKHDEETKSIIEQIRMRDISQANLASKKEIMEVKKQILDETFEKAVQAIIGMNDSKRKKLLEKILKKASEEIKIDSIYCRSEDIKLIDSKDYKIIAKPMVGGMILTSKDKNIVLDYSYDTLLDNVRNNNLQKIAGILF